MLKKYFLLASGLITFIFCSSQPSFSFIDHPVQLKNKPVFNLKIPASYKISPAVEGLKRPRFLQKAPMANSL